MAVEFVGIELQLRGAEGVKQDLQNIDRILNSLGGKKKLQTGLDQLRRDAVASKGEIQRLEKELERLNGIKAKYGDNTSAFVDRDIEKATEALKEQKQQYKDIMQAQREVQVSARSMGDTMKQTFDKISSSVTHIGSKMQSLGNAMVRLTSPFEKLTTGLLMGAGYKVLNKFTEGLSSGFSRYDTMKKYPKLMAEYATAAYTAEQSIQDLDKSVQGLPIALDDAVSLAQRYTLSLGDMERGTQLAIATNNAFLASMATEQQRYQGMLQLQDLLNGKELTGKEWMSLGSSMGKAINEIGKEFGYTDKNMGEFRQELYAGKIATEDFLKALEKVGTGEGSLVALARESMDTWEAFFSRVGTAASRMVYGTLKSLDALSQSMTGMDVNQLIDEKVIPTIDGMTASIKNWIDTHPEEIKNFFADLSKIDITGLITGLARGMADIAKFWGKLANLFGDKGLEGFGRMIMWTNLLGKGLLVLGGGLKGLAHPIAAIGTVLATAFGGKFSGLFGFFSKFLGKTKDAAQAEQAMASVPTFAQSLKKMVSSLSGVATVLGTVGLTALTGAIVFKSVKSIVSDIGEIADMVDSIGIDRIATIGGFITVFTGFVSAIAAGLATFDVVGLPLLGGVGVLAGITAIISGVAALDTWLWKKAVENIKGLTDALIDIKNNMKELEGIEFNDSAIETTMTSLNDVYRALKSEGGIGNIGMVESWYLKKVTKNLLDVIHQIKDFKDIGEEMRGFTGIPSYATDKIIDAFEELGRLYESLSSDFALKAHGSVAKDAKNILENTQKMFETMIGDNGIIAQISKIGEQIPSITEGATKLLKGKTGKVLEKQELPSALETMRDGMNDLFTEIGEMFKEFGAKVGFNAESNTSLGSRIVDNVNSMLNNIVGEDGIIASIAKVAPELKKITNATTLNGTSPMQDAKTYLDSLFRFLGDVFTMLVDEKNGLGMYQTVTKGSSGTANEILGNVKDMFATLLGEDGIIGQIANLLPQIKPLFQTSGENLSPLQDVEIYIEQLFQAINRIYTKFNDLDFMKNEGGMTTFSEAIAKLPQIMTDIKSAVETISGMGEQMGALAGEEGNFPIVEQIQNMISQLSSAFSVETISVLQAQVEGFKTTISNLLDSISSMVGMSEGNPLEVAITITHTISETASGAIKDAAKDIRNAWRQVPSSLSRTISVTISASVSTGGAIQAISAGAAAVRQAARNAGIGASTGGYIAKQGKVLYRRKGGEAYLMKPQGTDTIPAMLTPGEYVHRKQAVDFFGINFMQKINRLDVAGALNELMARAGHMANVGRQTIVHNTYNNNQKVIQNINTNSPDFAYKASSRYVGAF